MKKIISLIICGVLILSMAGCAKQEQPAAETAAETAAEIKAEPVTEAAEDQSAEPETEPAKPESQVLAKIPEKIELIHPVTMTGYQGAQDSENRILYEIRWGSAALEEDEAERFPALDESLKKAYEESKETILDRRDQTVLTDPEIVNREGFEGFQISEEPQIMRCDTAFTSVKQTIFEATGGAHPSTMILGYTYSTQDGSEVKLADIFTDENAVNDVLYERLKTDYKDVDFFDLANDIKRYRFTPGTDEYSYDWILGYDGVTFIFNQYSLAPYAWGIQTVTLGFKDYPELYFDGLDCYHGDFIKPLGTFVKEYYDGKTLEITYDSSQGYMIDTLTIDIDGKKYDFEVSTYSVDPYLVRCDGTDFIYVYMSHDDDERSCAMYEIREDMVLPAENMRGGIPSINEAVEVERPFEGYNCFQRLNINYVPVDPLDIKLTDR